METNIEELKRLILNSHISLDEIKALVNERKKMEERNKRDKHCDLRKRTAEFIVSLAVEKKCDPALITLPPGYWNPGCYRDPNDSSRTWKGRGRSPDWYKAYIEGGGKKEDIWVRSDKTIDGVEIPRT